MSVWAGVTQSQSDLQAQIAAKRVRTTHDMDIARVRIRTQRERERLTVVAQKRKQKQDPLRSFASKKPQKKVGLAGLISHRSNLGLRTRPRRRILLVTESEENKCVFV
jgi:hypothetical protein